MNEILKDLFYLCCVFVLSWVTMYLFTRHDTIEQRVTRYDCNLTEFIAGIPDDIRNQCRIQHLQTINNKQKD